MPVHFTPMRWEIGSPFEKYFDALLTASWAGVSEHSIQWNIEIQYAYIVTLTLDEEVSAIFAKAYRKKAYEGDNHRV